MTKIKHLLFPLFTITIVFLVYSLSLNRDWQYFDEKIIYDEGIFPIATNLKEVFEIISLYAFDYHTESQNAFFSNIINIRSNPLGAALYIFALYLFKKNFFYYHLLSLFIHLISTALVWLTFHKLLRLLNPQSSIINHQSSILSTLLTLIWALHPANTEAVLLGTNWSSLLNYTFCFGFILYYTCKLTKENFKNSTSETYTITFLFFLSTLISEYSNILPLVLFFISFGLIYKNLNLISKSLIDSFKLCLPLFYGSLCFGIYSLTKPFLLAGLNTTVYEQIKLFLERVLWLSPQIFWHFLKLFFYPRRLSTYQTNLVHLADTLFSPYALFTLFVFLLFLITPILLFLFLDPRHKKNYVFLFAYPFILSLVPYLHLISPTYCLIADRYCYFPLFTLMLFIAAIIGAFHNAQVKYSKRILISVLIISLVALSTRTIIRMKDWKDSFSLFSSAISSSSNKLNKGFGYSVLGYYFDSTHKADKMKKYMLSSVKYLKAAIYNLSQEKSNSSPYILKVYGLDKESLIQTAAFTISYIRFNNFKEKPEEVLKFYEPYIKDKLLFSGCSQLDLYAKLLTWTKQYKKAQEVLEFAKKKYPYSPLIIYTLSNFYLYKTHELNKAEKIIQEGYRYYPSYRRILLRLIKISEIKKDFLNLGRYQYLLGLRIHSQKAFLRAAQIYLFLNKLKEAKRILDKSLDFDKRNPVTLLLLSKYYYLSGEQSKILETLNLAYTEANKLGDKLDLNIYKSILLSLISFNINYSNYAAAKNYIQELEQLPNLQKEEIAYASAMKKKIR